MKFLNHNLFTGDITVSGITTLNTATGITRATGDNSTHLATTAFVKNQGYATTASLAGYVPITRTLTINGTTLDLSADRAWTIASTGTVTTVYETVKNASGSIIYKGTPLAVVPGQTSGNVSDVVPADAADPTKMPAVFIANENIADEAEGEAVLFGYFSGVDTSLYQSGTTVYVAPGGGWTATKPVYPNKIQNLGVITKQHATNGAGIVTGVGRANDLPNLTAGKIWVGTANYPIESTTVHVDEANSRLGIGTTSPATKLHVYGGASSSTAAVNALGIFEGGANSVIQLNVPDANAAGLFFGRNGAAYYSGIERDGTNLFIKNNSSVRVSINSSGQVGVGSTSMYHSSAFSVAGKQHFQTGSNTDIGGAIYSTWTQSANGSDYYAGDLRFQIFNAATGTYGLQEAMMIDGKGFVGIGTTSPSYKLEVQGNGRFADINQVFGSIEVGGYYSPSSAYWTAKIVGDYFGAQYNPSLLHGMSFIGGRSGFDNFRFFDSSYNELFTIRYTGNVGIGTTSPGYKLDVATGNDDAIRILNSAGGNNNGLALSVGSGTPWLDFYGGRFDIKYNASPGSWNSGANIFLSVLSTGNVGIGNTNPLYKLDVAGAVRLTGSLVLDDTTSNLIQHRSGTDVNTLVTVGHGGFDHNGYLRIGGADVATRAWVQAQGYITGYTETDTLASVTARGSSTAGSIFVNGLITGGLGAVATSGTLDWNDVSNARSGSGYTLLLGTATNGMGGGQYYHPISFEYSSKNGSGNMTQLAIPYTGNGIWYRNRYGGSWSTWARVWDDSSFTSTNISNWNTAYGWGNHASQGYATQTYVNTAISNLVDAAPTTLDTLNELAAALGDDPNFATTVTNSIAGKVSKSGDTMSGALTLNGGLNAYAAPILVNEIKFRDTAGSPQSDPYSIRWISEASTRGAGLSWLEFQLNDDNNEEIRIYGNSCVNHSCGAYSDNLYHRFRADGYAWHAGNLEIGGTFSASGYNKSNWDTAYSWGNHSGLYVPINPDGDGPAWTYSDENPTINGNYVGGGQRFGADGDSVVGGFLQARLLNAYEGHVNSTYGYYVGSLEYGANSGTHTTTQVINSSGAWVGTAIADNKIASSGNWNTAYGWGNHAGLYIPVTANTNATGWISFSSSTQGTPIIKAIQQDSSGGYYLFQGITGSSEVFRVERSGNVIIAGTFTETSSIRFKENIVDLEPVTDKVEKLRPVQYNKINSEVTEIGLIAEEVAELFPEVVTYNENGQPSGVQYQRLSVILLKTIQEQNVALAALTERINKLENK